MAVVPDLVKRWLQEEGIFFQEQPRAEVVAQWAIKVPVDIQQSINMVVGIPKGKEDMVVVSITIIPGEASQKTFAAMSDDQKQILLRQFVEEYLKLGLLLPVFGQQPDGRLNIALSISMFEDAPLTKNRVMDAISRLRNGFLFYEVVNERIFRQFAPEGELLKP